MLRLIIPNKCKCPKREMTPESDWCLRCKLMDAIVCECQNHKHLLKLFAFAPHHSFT